jgi:hypothetical protein
VAATSPLTAKEIAQKAMEAAQEASFFEASGISPFGDSIYTSSYVPDLTPDMRSLWDAIRDLGMPQWKREDLRDDARRSRTLDPDIASMRSLSLGAKMRKQWNRNYELLVERAMRQIELERMKKLFFEEHPDVEEY